MKRKNRPYALAPTMFALAAFITFSPVAFAQPDDNLAFAAEVDSCVAAIYAHLDLENANRVRHLVSDARRTGIGYALTIETSVFSNNAETDSEKRYEAYCVARGDNVLPSRFRIEQIEI